MSLFDAATDWVPDADGAFEGALDEGWGQGRAVFGGMITAGAYRLLRHRVDPERTAREVHTRYVGPLPPGPVRVRSEILREGGSITQAEARVYSPEGLAAVVLAAFARPRKSELAQPGPVAPERPDPSGFVDMPYVPGVTPAFLDRFSLRWVEGQPPFTGATEPRLAGWGAVEGTELDGTAIALALLDAWPTPFLAMLTRPAAASTVAWTAYLHDVPASGAGWWWYTEEGLGVRDGGAVSDARLYGPDGRLAGSKTQLAAIYG